MSITDIAASPQVIRTWARDNGYDVPNRGPIPADVREAWAAASPEATAVEETTPGERPPGIDDTRPARPSKLSWLHREKAVPKSRRARVSIAEVVSGGWQLGAMIVGQNPAMLPMSRVLTMQAPVAGEIVNDVAKNTVIDTLLQPIARASAKGTAVAALVGPPLIVGAITARPDYYPVLKPVLKMTLMSWLQVAAPAMKKAQRKAEKLAEEFGEIDVDSMIDALFAPPPGWTPPQEPEPAGTPYPATEHEF